jgi:release factor glutamine methyltransferase
MTPRLPARDLAAVAAKLRAAGCVFAEDEALLLTSAARTGGELAAMADRRAAGMPIEHVVGWAEFCGLRIDVEPGVFVPRRRTEFLVTEAIAAARQAAGTGGGKPASAGPVIVDLCSGSGAVAAALAAGLQRGELHAVDIDPAAVRCARRNLRAAGARVHQGDLFEPLPETLRGRVDLLTVNAPYVPTGELGLLPAEARLHEPRLALDGGPDGLGLLRRVVAAAAQWLAPAGVLAAETSERQAVGLAAAAARCGLVTRVSRSADRGAAVLLATLP